MCGIAGGVFWNDAIGVPDARAAVSAMVDAQSHRGPDGHGLFTSASAGNGDAFSVLGHRRLAIIDVSSAGAQPMGGEGQRPAITYNGEIYNFATLRRELEQQGARFTSHCDTEVLLRGYDVWGRDLLTRLRGMFAFALWDEHRHELLIARDRLGIKPVYVYRGDRYLLFASEVRALLTTGLVPRRLDATATTQYFAYQSIPAPRTLVDGVAMLEPARWLSVGRSGRVASGDYWHMLQSAPADNTVSPQEAHRRIGTVLREAVNVHMVSDVPVGAFLSGGIDSSAVVALMREAGHTPHTFSVGFDEQAFDESSHAALIARTFQCEHTHIQLRANDLLDQLPTALAAMDQPTGDGINTYVVSGAVHNRGLKVALSGLGGDEIFGGYPSFKRLMRIVGLTRTWGRSPAMIRRLAGGTLRSLAGKSIQTTKAAAILESNGQISSMFPLLRQLLSANQREALISSSLRARIEDTDDPYKRLLEDEFTRVPDATSFSQVSFAETRTYMHDVLLRDTDQMSMAHALEARVPLLDHQLIEEVMALPDEVKWPRNGTPKPLLVAALGDHLPASIVHRPKQGFVLPFDPWIRGPLRTLCDARLGAQGLSGRGLLNADALQRLWQSFLNGSNEVSWSRIWTLVVFGEWLERHGVE
ncbi:MAG: asparagine synthase (glutamine-hydrolyzing) [Acidobacteriaceae bacterium]|jgi:asparagine synthase (glutamine-hydrolysing)|nr:asparagine synthase (glutamine-hydrolyzing) [Acidobacteriaceae bacterium]